VVIYIQATNACKRRWKHFEGLLEVAGGGIRCLR